MKKLLILSTILFTLNSVAQTITTKFEQSQGKQTPTYFEIIDWWKKLDAASAYIKMQPMKMTDAGYPLHLILISADKDFNIESNRKKNKRIILVNNGIHPGEPDGIDASMLLTRDMDAYWKQEERNRNSPGARKRINSKLQGLPDNILLAIIPVYNIGGCLNRSSNYRVDQNGPEEFGFRGNSQNLDLNRDFIKCDSKDARAFAEIFHLLDPDVFIDNHVSNGADYQYTMTLLSSQHNKLGGEMGAFLHEKMEPALFESMKAKGNEMTPYVNIHGNIPDSGWVQFWDSPKYSSGYGTLWNTFSFMPETHMLKTYEQRVKATLQLMESFIWFVEKYNNEIKAVRYNAKQSMINANEFPVSWKIDSSKYTTLQFKGYESGYKKSDVSGLNRLYYDRNKPFEKPVNFYNTYQPTSFVKKPKAYIIPQGWWKAIDLLKLNNVQMQQLKKDTSIEVEVYHIEDYKSSARQYEGHHMNGQVKTSSSVKSVLFRKGDWYIPMNQVANRFLIETLEPTCEDSYFAWNFFDAILGQKEGYSNYAFEDIAAEYLQQHAAVKRKLDERKLTDTTFANNAGAQLDFVYENSPWLERAYLSYPVYRVVK